jgi:hypothetical protein
MPSTYAYAHAKTTKEDEVHVLIGLNYKTNQIRVSKIQKNKEKE